MEPVPRLLLIGDFQHREFREAVDWLRSHTRLATASCVAEALQQEEQEEQEEAEPLSFSFILFALSRPGLIASAEVDRISRRFPLAHLVTLLGSLCEGEPLPRTPAPGVVRVYWHQFHARCQRELLDLTQRSSWQLPRTTSEVERIETVLRARPPQQTGLVALFTRSVLLCDALHAACQQAGHATVWCRQEIPSSFRGATAAIWDGVTGGEADFSQLARIRHHWPQVPLIALLAFPRYDQWLEARRCGASELLSCPFLLPDLWSKLRAVS